MKSFAVTGLVGLALSSVATAAPILAVDAGLSTGSQIQAGFVGFEIANPAGSAAVTRTFTGLSGITSGEIAMTLYGTGTMGGRDRGAFSGGAPEFTYYSLYRDLITQVIEGTSGSTVTVQLAGLDPNTPYLVQLWSHDRNFNNGATYTWNDTTTGTAVLIGTITNVVATSSPQYTNNNVFSVTGTVTADASGVIKLAHNDGSGTGTFNGLAISVVPEPGTLSMLGLAGAALLFRRRA